MNTQIPIYRAKKKDSNEYTEGFLYQDIISYVPSDGVKPDEYNKALDEESWFLMDNMGRNEMIDITTLAIHFPDMVDSQGNKIFASLNKDGKGGDCTFMENNYNETFMWDTLNACVVLKSKHYECKCFRNGNRKETTFDTYTILGIQQ